MRYFTDETSWYASEKDLSGILNTPTLREVSETEYNNNTGMLNGEFIITLEDAKMIKTQELSLLFQDQFQYGKFNCSLGFPVDNRRFGDKNDKDNVQSMIDMGITTFKDADGNFHQLTIEQLLQIKMEMVADGLRKYQTKWNFENIISSTTDINALNNLTITF